MKKAIIFICFGFILPLFIKAQDSEQVNMKMQLLKNALLSKDSISIAGLLNDDVSYGHSNGLVQTKAQLISDVMSGAQSYKSIEVSEMNFRVYNNTVVVTSKQKVNLMYNNKPLDLNMHATFVWIKLNGEWKLVARQSVKLPET